jgi:signal peptidase
MVVRGARIALDAVLALLLALSVALLVVTMVLPQAGYRLLIVRSGSMAPAMPVGSLALVGPAPATPEPGEVVTFRLESGTLVTHRIARTFTLDGVPYIATKGDANAQEDPAASPASAIVGRLLWARPDLGFVVAFIQSGLGRVAFLLILLTLIALRYFWEDLFPALDGAVAEADADGPAPAGLPGDASGAPGPARLEV